MGPQHLKIIEKVKKEFLSKHWAAEFYINIRIICYTKKNSGKLQQQVEAKETISKMKKLQRHRLMIVFMYFGTTACGKH